MESEQVKRRFGRCPYCRAMIYQDPNAIIYYCSKCRTPIRGKNPEPTDDAEYALSQLEILSADTASVFSDDPDTLSRTSSVAYGGGGGEQPPVRTSSALYAAFDRGSVRAGSRSGGQSGEERGGGSPMHSRVSELRPTSRRTRRPMSGDMGAFRDDGSSYGSDNDVPTSAAASYRRRASPLSSQELEASSSSMGSSGYQPSGASSSSMASSSVYEPSGAARSQLTDPAFQRDLLQALDNLRRVIAAVEQPYGVEAHLQQAGMPPKSASCNDAATGGGGGGGGAYAAAVTRRNSRLMRRLESQLVQALPRDGLRRDRSTSSSSSTSSSRPGSDRARAAGRKHHCRAVLGGTPFVVCDKCSEILQLPAAVPVNRAARLECGACGETLSIKLPAAASGSTDRPRKIFSAPQPVIRGLDGDDAAEEHASARSNLSGDQRWPASPAEGPLHRMLGYSTVSSVFRSRRYGEQH
uniref:Probable zinc-ribbon domain-containing protein n=1 Tax=Oryza meridionalis TaxID=40149 RepID=A0A0E0C9I6_9ORYZ